MNFLQLNKIISIKNFYIVGDFERIQINKDIEYNYLKYSNPSLGYNFPIREPNNSFFHKIYDKFLTESFRIFGDFSLSQNNSSLCWCYRSRNDDFSSFWHDHKDTSIINAVYYYQTQEGDSISFFDANNDEIEYNVSEGELLIFPNNLLHKPNPPVSGISDRYRYSINLEIQTDETTEEIFNRI